MAFCFWLEYPQERTRKEGEGGRKGWDEVCLYLSFNPRVQHVEEKIIKDKLTKTEKKQCSKASFNTTEEPQEAKKVVVVPVAVVVEVVMVSSDGGGGGGRGSVEGGVGCIVGDAR